MSTSDRNFLSGVVAVMKYFLEATNILQQEGNPTSNRVIPVVDSLENALIQTSRENAAVNALCECLLNSLQRRFNYLHSSTIYQAATVLDPQ